MQIIWSQILTNIVGFIIAVLILKRFAWGPILRVLEERRTKIQGEFDRIEAERAVAASLKTEYEAQLRGIEAQARARLQEAVQEGQKVGAEVKEQAREEARRQMERAREEIARERDKAQVALRDEMVAMVIHATQTLIHERLDEPRQRKLIQEFLISLEGVRAKGGAAS